jgi:DNA-directed RNA polymerase specialized sigma24 family protein
MSQEEVLQVIDKVSGRLARKFQFGYHTYEDIKQQAFIFAWQGLESYDGVRPLENFLSIHCHNRLCNYKRKLFERLDSPCLKCPLGAYAPKLENKCTRFENRMNCELYLKWFDRNTTKKNIVNCADLDNIDDVQEPRMAVNHNYIDNIEYTKLVDTIDEKLPMNLRESYLKLKAGVKIGRRDKEAIQDAIAKILYPSKDDDVNE